MRTAGLFMTGKARTAASNVGIGDHAGTLESAAAARQAPDPNLLPGAADVAAPDSDSGDAGSGYMWDEVLRAGLTVRNYGFFCDLDALRQSERPIPASSRILEDAVRGQDSAGGDHEQISDSSRPISTSAASIRIFRTSSGTTNGSASSISWLPAEHLPNLTLLRACARSFRQFRDGGGWDQHAGPRIRR